MEAKLLIDDNYNAIVQHNLSINNKAQQSFRSIFDQHLNQDINKIVQKNEVMIASQRTDLEAKSEIFAKTLKQTIEQELRNYHINVMLHLQNASELEKINLMTFFEGFKNILISLFGESFRGLIENEELTKDLNRVWESKINDFTEVFKKKMNVPPTPTYDNSLHSIEEKSTLATSKQATFKKTAFDDDDDKYSIKKSQTSEGPSPTKEERSKSIDKGKDDDKNKKGVIEIIKDIFSRKKVSDDPSKPTKMHLGDEKNFFYDSVKKKYIFKGEEDVPEEEIPLPPKMGLSSGIHNKEEKNEEKPVEPLKEEKKSIDASDLMKPPSRLPLSKKKESKASSINLMKPGFIPQSQVFKPVMREEVNEENKDKLVESVLSFGISKSHHESLAPIDKTNNKSIGIVEEFKRDIEDMVKRFSVNIHKEDFSGLVEIMRQASVHECQSNAEKSSYIEINNYIQLNEIESDYQMKIENIYLKKMLASYNDKMKQLYHELMHSHPSLHIEGNIYEDLYNLKVNEQFSEESYEANNINIHYKDLRVQSEIIGKLIESLKRCDVMNDENYEIEREKELIKAKYNELQQSYENQDQIINTFQVIIEEYQQTIIKKDKLLLELKEEIYQSEMNSLEMTKINAIIKKESTQNNHQISNLINEKNDLFLSLEAFKKNENQQANRFKDEINALSKTIEYNDERINGLGKTIESNDECINELNKRIESNDEYIDKLNTKMESNYEYINDLKEQLNLKESSVTNLQNWYNEIEEKLNNERAAYTQKTNLHSDEIAELTKVNRELERKCDQYTTHNFLLLKKNEAKDKIIEELNGTIDEIKDRENVII